MTLRILLASPVKQTEMILSQFLESLEFLNSKDLELDFAFIDDGNDHNLLTHFAQGKTNTRIFRPGHDFSVSTDSSVNPPGPGQTLPLVSPSLDHVSPVTSSENLDGPTSSPSEPSSPYLRDERTHYWQEDLVWKVAFYKDFLIELARTKGYDYLFLVDSDLYLHPQTLRHLVSLAKDIVSEVFWTQWNPELISLPQVWVSDQYTLYQAARDEYPLSEAEIAQRTSHFIAMLSQPGTYKVGGLGACTLISKQALSRGVSFKKIYNLTFSGEDRHFCIRAAALGLELYADTHFPPFHIYRESELTALEDYKKQILNQEPPSATDTDTDTDARSDLKLNPSLNINSNAKISTRTNTAASANTITSGHVETQASNPDKNRLTLVMLLRNESDRYLDKVLEQARQYIDAAVILDDASEDNTVEICRRELAGLPLTLFSNPEPGFGNEVNLRKQLWTMVSETSPQWILILDADEMFEERATALLRGLLTDPEAYFYSFRLYDMWSENAYREDAYWNAHQTYRPFLVRYVPGFPYRWLEIPQHCGRFPRNITELKGKQSDLRIKHFGWQKPLDRLRKYERYQKLDPGAVYGLAAQYESILDPRPHLVLWQEGI